MPKAISFISGSVQHSIYQALCARGPHIKKTLDRLLSSVPMPLDAPCLGAYFSPLWTAFQAERRRDFSVIVDGISN